MIEDLGNWGGGCISSITSGSFSSNAYICEGDFPGGCILIDPGLDHAVIDGYLVERGLAPAAVYCTHGHFDHSGSAAFFQKKYDCNVFLHSNDEKIIKTSNFLLMILKSSERVDLPLITYVSNGFKHEIGSSTLKFIFTPGHTPGSCIIELGNAWFTGDTIYSNGVGLSKLPSENHVQLKISLLSIWDKLNEKVNIYPGHGKHANGLFIKNNNSALLDFLGI